MSPERVHKNLFYGHVIKTWVWFGHENRGQKAEKRSPGDGKGAGGMQVRTRRGSPMYLSFLYQITGGL